MERRYNLRPRVSGRVQSSNTTQYFRPQQHAPPAGVPPSSDVHSLRQALLSAEEDNLKLSCENAAMRQQIADLQEGSTKLMHDNSCLQRTLGRKLHVAKQTISKLETASEAAKSGQEDSKKREKTFREKEKEISSLRGSLEAQKEETERLRHFWAKELDRTSAAFESELVMVKSECDTQRSSDLQQMQAECQRKVSQLQEQISEQDREISTIRVEIKARSEELYTLSSQLGLKQTELDQSINKCNALEEEFKKQLAEREESWKTIGKLETALEAAKAGQEEFKKREETFREKETEISSLQESLEAQKEETERLRDFWVKELDRTSAAFDSELKMVRSECDTQRSSDLQQMQAECQRKVSQLQEQISEQDREISTFQAEIKARSEENYTLSSQLGLKQTELDQSINKCNALEEQFKKQLAEREESWERTQKEMEKLWQEKEEALKKKASKAEEELKLVIIKNIHLQELDLQKPRKKNKKEKKEKRRGFWGKKKPEISSEEEEAAVCSAQAGQEDEGKERKEKKRGFWSWARKKKSSHSDRVEEVAACPAQDGQQ